MIARFLISSAAGMALLCSGASWAQGTAQGSSDWAEQVRAKLRQSKARVSRSAVISPRHTKVESEEPFRVEANYRGVVKKRFDALGAGVLRCVELGSNEFSVELYAKAKYPGKDDEKDEAKKNIEFRVKRKFQLAGQHVKVLQEENQFNETAAKYQNKILNTVSLAYLIKFRTPNGDATPTASTSYVIDGRTYTLSYGKARGKLEVTLKDDQDTKPIGKFFLSKTPTGVFAFDFFRVNTRDDVNVEFWIQPMERGAIGG